MTSPGSPVPDSASMDDDDGEACKWMKRFSHDADKDIGFGVMLSGREAEKDEAIAGKSVVTRMKGFARKVADSSSEYTGIGRNC